MSLCYSYFLSNYLFISFFPMVLFVLSLLIHNSSLNKKNCKPTQTKSYMFQLFFFEIRVFDPKKFLDREGYQFFPWKDRVIFSEKWITVFLLSNYKHKTKF